MSLEEKENGIEQENNTPEPAGHTGEAGSENSAPVKRRPQNRRPVQRRTARPKNTSEEGSGKYGTDRRRTGGRRKEGTEQTGSQTPHSGSQTGTGYRQKTGSGSFKKYR